MLVSIYPTAYSYTYCELGKFCECLFIQSVVKEILIFTKSEFVIFIMVLWIDKGHITVCVSFIFCISSQSLTKVKLSLKSSLFHTC